MSFFYSLLIFGKSKHSHFGGYHWKTPLYRKWPKKSDILGPGPGPLPWDSGKPGKPGFSRVPESDISQIPGKTRFFAKNRHFLRVPALISPNLAPNRQPDRQTWRQTTRQTRQTASQTAKPGARPPDLAARPQNPARSPKPGKGRQGQPKTAKPVFDHKIAKKTPSFSRKTRFRQNRPKSGTFGQKSDFFYKESGDFPKKRVFRDSRKVPGTGLSLERNFVICGPPEQKGCFFGKPEKHRFSAFL